MPGFKNSPGRNKLNVIIRLTLVIENKYANYE